MLNPENMIATLNAISEPSRLRILILLREGDLTVSDLMMILKQSQPRVSRHVKLLQDSHIICRYQEGSRAYFHLCEAEPTRALLEHVLVNLDRQDTMLQSDMRRLEDVKAKRRTQADAYFSAHAQEWDSLRLLYVAEQQVEQTLLQMVGNKSIEKMLDMGTGTGSMLKLFAPYAERALGIDNNHDMLNVARSNLERHHISNAHVRAGDVTALDLEKATIDLVVIHQVLHFLADPQIALQEAARVLRSDGRLLVVDFATHAHEFLRESHAHLRLGFSDKTIGSWLQKTGLSLQETRQIEPQEGSEALTIKLWLATK